MRPTKLIVQMLLVAALCVAAFASPWPPPDQPPIVAVSPVATVAVASPSNPAGAIQIFGTAVLSKQYALAVIAGLVLLIGAVRTYAPIAFLKTRAGGWVANFVMTALVTVCAAGASGTPFSLGMVLHGAMVALGNAAAWQAVKDSPLPFGNAKAGA